jgi:hypothetical protein
VKPFSYKSSVSMAGQDAPKSGLRVPVSLFVLYAAGARVSGASPQEGGGEPGELAQQLQGLQAVLFFKLSRVKMCPPPKAPASPRPVRRRSSEVSPAAPLAYPFQ